MMQPDQQRLFLEQFRTGPGVVAFRPVGGTFSEHHFDNHDAALRLIAQFGRKAETWVSMATYPQRGSRKAANAEKLCAFWIDIDAHGPRNKYASVEEALAAAREFIRRSGLPTPSATNMTGHGAHLLWAFTHEIPRAEWQFAADITPEHVEWLVPDSLPLGMLAVIGGQPGLGKSQIAISLAAAVTAGKELPGGAHFEKGGSVVILANEDDAARTIRPRLEAAGADTRKVHIVEGIAREGRELDLFQLDQDVADLRDLALHLGDVRLVVIDPPTAYLGSRVDSYKDADVRRVLLPLSTLAQETGALILLIVHLNKRNDAGAQQRFSGSTAWIAAPRAAFIVAEDGSDKRRYMLPAKVNVGNDRLGYQYRVSGELIEIGDRQFATSKVVWKGTTERPAQDLLNPPRTERTSAVDEAVAFLQDELAAGPASVKDLRDRAKQAGISWGSVQRAKKQCLVVAEKMADHWRWSLLPVNPEGVLDE